MVSFFLVGQGPINKKIDHVIQYSKIKYSYVETKPLLKSVPTCSTQEILVKMFYTVECTVAFMRNSGAKLQGVMEEKV